MAVAAAAAAMATGAGPGSAAASAAASAAQRAGGARRIVLFFRNDLRLRDNAIVAAAAEKVAAREYDEVRLRGRRAQRAAVAAASAPLLGSTP